jgi:hypothetical protein
MRIALLKSNGLTVLSAQSMIAPVLARSAMTTATMMLHLTVASKSSTRLPPQFTPQLLAVHPLLLAETLA